ncbi:bifunctional aconitate hydratase 2/2-methylisocitrate dehydratase [Seleniivibrio sp.]|uniref:bifunctional aconitate hydratase 2/2-methylisocitrate dehydratase n=1 Tax=Seleniivibrio sp. TaxID=2898801 RepID=UPI0025EA8DE9|nr:bifunctional aconitate hydratase 2/2-methylisocitrate dehydratase [Seleniivibrio sp.]MCD8554602.1 bifunctional aconitate hydratase 2/2-methylisocitrate dehydratase [Seleniivibrio sp.]
MSLMQEYLKQVEDRAKMGIPALPLTPEFTAEVCKLLEQSSATKELVDLIENRVAPGVDPASEVKANWLAKVAKGETKSPLIDKKRAVFLLGTMLGGYNVKPLVELLTDAELGAEAAEALKKTILVYGAFDEVVALSKTNANAMAVLKSWADAEWFTSKPELRKEYKVKVYKVSGEINTDDFSPAKHAWSRPDIPLHALAMGETRFPDGNATMEQYKAEGFEVAFVGDVVGTGSSRKSACNSVMWRIGSEIPFVPNKKNGGTIIGNVIAPIFFNTTQDSGGLPIACNVDAFNTGDVIVINTEKGEIKDEAGKVLSTFTVKPATLKDEYRAGGRLNLIIGRQLTGKARAALGLGETTVFTIAENPVAKPGQGYTLAQKIIGKACGLAGVLPGAACEPKMTTVGSQDTTGPMTRDEIKELACLEFLSPMFMQSFCHTAAYPKAADVKMHKSLPDFVAARKGVALRPGDGVIHSWLNRLLLPDTLGTGGDSHTRFPMGLSLPAGSGLVAFAGALGFMPLDVPESVLVKFKGKLNPGITLRDVVNAIPYWAIKQGLLTVPKKNKVNVFNGRILEMEGLPDLTVEQAFELTDATAERSAAGGTIKLSEKSVAEYIKSNIALMKKMIKAGYQDANTLQKRIDDCEAWLKNPVLLERDANAEYAAVIEIDLADIKEPILACPNDPDDVKLLSEVAGTKVDETFIGSCMTNIGHFRAAGKIWEGVPYPKTRMWLTPPTLMDEMQLKEEGYYSIFSSVGARTELPGCSLCMGNQGRVAPGATVLSTSTRNFPDRIGDGANVFLGSAELTAIAAVLGEIPSVDKYFEYMNTKVAPKAAEIYKYLEFDKMGDFELSYVETVAF